MLNHAQIWQAIDGFAARHGMTASGLARKAGLDATTFNRSKRVSPEGRERWPSTESVAKILAATGASLDSFLDLVSKAGGGSGGRSLPLLGFAQAGQGGFFDDGGFPVGSGWDEIEFPGTIDESAYALEIQGDSMQPAYRDGTIIIVSPSSPTRRGDRVVVRTKAGEVTAKELKRRTAKTIELTSLNPEHPERTFAMEEIDWIGRVLWASQ